MNKKKSRVYKVLIYLVVFALGGMTASCLAVWKANGIHRVVSEYRERVAREKENKFMHEETTDISSYPPLEDEEDAWYTRYHFIAHGGGAVDGKYYTNSKEAWEASYAKGNRVFDADLNFTSDRRLILRHSWNDALEQNGASINDTYRFIDENGHIQYVVSEGPVFSYDEFLRTPIHFKYSPMSAEDMVLFLAEHREAYVAIDYKGDAGEVYEKLLQIISSLKCEDVLDQIIVNFYTEEDYRAIMDLYPFKNVTARQHYVSPNNYYRLTEFCLENNIHVVNLSSCYIEDSGVQLFREKGIHVYVAVTDYISQMKEYHDRYGADGAVTNWLYEDDWKYIEN